MTTYYALDNPHPVYDYDCTGNVIVYDGHTEDGYVVDGYHNDADVDEGRYDNAYIYDSWRLG